MYNQSRLVLGILLMFYTILIILYLVSHVLAIKDLGV